MNINLTRTILQSLDTSKEYNLVIKYDRRTTKWLLVYSTNASGSNATRFILSDVFSWALCKKVYNSWYRYSRAINDSYDVNWYWGAIVDIIFDNIKINSKLQFLQNILYIK